jgi:glyceraldehyde 3-phosphate dehydrogenase
MQIGVNGFGRIGRTVLRRAWLSGADAVVHVNDPHMTPQHAAYLLTYDSAYGRFPAKVSAGHADLTVSEGNRAWQIAFTAHRSLLDVPWTRSGVTAVVEASGIDRNAADCRMLTASGARFAVITQASPHADRTIVFGANDGLGVPPGARVFATSTCDAVAIAPIVATLGYLSPIEHVRLTTLHPWLGYQNLVDGPVRSLSGGAVDPSLGRASHGALIPKTTTAARCVEQVLPDIVGGRITGMSYRVPTASVCYCNAVFRFRSPVSTESALRLLEAAHPYLRVCAESLISIDLLAEEASAVVDSRFCEQIDDQTLHLAFGYDNEWGFSGRVVDLVVHIATELAARLPERIQAR